MIKTIRITVTNDQAETLKNMLEWVMQKSIYGMTIIEREAMLSLVRNIKTKLNYREE